MNRDLHEEFIFNFIKDSKLPYLSRLSGTSPRNFSNNNKEQIKIGNQNIKIPDKILAESLDSEIEISGFSDITKNIYYMDPVFQKYYEIKFDISLDQYRLDVDEHLNINLNFKKTEELELCFILIEFSETKGIVARKYNNLSDVTVNPHPDTQYIKIYIEIIKAGFIYDVFLNVDKQKMNILNNYTFNMLTKDLYNPNDKVKFIDNENKVRVQVPNLNKKFLYFSYGINNNSFNKLPESSLINIDSKNLYQITTPYYKVEEVDFTPTIIEYNKVGKTNLLKLSNNAEFVRFQNDTNSIRLSYRFVGVGEVEILPVTIIEYEPETVYSEVNWSSRHEIDVYMKTIKDLKDLRIATIMDEFTFHSYQHEANLLRLSANNWKNEVISFMPHFLLIESSWHGNNGDWTKKVAYVTEEKHQEIKDLVYLAKSLSIPVVFWNKEDPVHYDHFIHTAKLCDYVFTTDRDRVEDYKSACNHENVDVLQFAAQPRTHNPTKIQKERVEGISFAGSYYALREERSNDMNRLFKASIPHNLYIYDRNYEYTKIGEKMNFLFPEEFREYILGSLPFYQIDKAYKGYKYMININTVKTSPTMYARRVYEGLASGTPIISNYSLGMMNQFGDIIGASESEEELLNYLENLENNPDEYNKVKQLGIRRVLTEHTYEHRLLQITNTLGLDIKKKEFKVQFVSIVNNKDDIDQVLSIFNHTKYINKELLIISLENINDYSIIESKVMIFSLSNLLKTYSTMSKLINAEYILPISKYDYYGENYVLDMFLPTLYTDAEVIGKANHYEWINNALIEKNFGKEYEYNSSIEINNSLLKTRIFQNMSLHEALEYISGKRSMTNLEYMGIQIYSSDKMNYIKNGNNADKNIKEEVTI